MKNKDFVLNNYGVTLIALVVTITILLILAGIGIAALTGENGLIKRASDAKEETEVAEEKEIIQQAVVQAMGRNKRGDIVEDELQIACDNVTRPGMIEIDLYKNKLKAYFTDSKRTYIIDSDGNVTKKKDVILPENLQVGSIVTYAPEGSTYNWQAEYASSDLTPVTDDVTLDSRSGGDFRVTSWKVFKIDEDTGEVQLVPNTMPSGTVRLQGAQGYNNGVKMLNDACSELYKNDSKEITARSINIEDIESILDETKLAEIKVNAGVGTQDASAYSTYMSYFPRIYEEENKSVINGIQNSEGYAQSIQGNKLYSRTEDTSLEEGQTKLTKATDGYLQAKNNIQPYQTYYLWHAGLQKNNFSDNTKANEYYSILTSKNYWIASRALKRGKNSCNYFILSVEGISIGYIGGVTNGLFISYRIPETEFFGGESLFPIVTVDSSIISQDGNNFRVNL